MKVKEVMSYDAVSVEPQTSIKKVAQMMIKKDIGSLLVQKDNDIIGIITESDIVRAFAKGMKPDTDAKDVMTKGVIIIGANAKLEEAAKTMTKYAIKRLPVVERDICIGIVTATDLITYEERLIDKLAEILVVRKKKPEAA